MRGIDIREADRADASGIALRFQIPQGIEPARVGEGPRVKLEHIDAVRA
jgi:hypothetical protein